MQPALQPHFLVQYNMVLTTMWLQLNRVLERKPQQALKFELKTPVTQRWTVTIPKKKIPIIGYIKQSNAHTQQAQWPVLYHFHSGSAKDLSESYPAGLH